MGEYLYPFAAVLAWWATGYRLRELRRDRSDHALAALCLAYGLLAAVFTMMIPAVWVAIDRATGIRNLSVLLTHAGFLLFALAALAMLRLSQGEPRACRRSGVCALVVAAALAAMSALFLSAPPVAEQSRQFVALNAGRPLISVYLIVYLLPFSWLYAQIAMVCLRQARTGAARWLRRGLRLAAASSLLAQLYVAGRLADVIGAHRGLDPTVWEPYTQGAVGIAVILLPLGWTMPAWGPQLSKSLAYTRLYRLWRHCADTIPAVILDTPTRWRPRRLAMRDVDFKLIRRHIELDDARMHLRPLLDPAIAQRARQAAEAEGLHGDHADVLVEAALLTQIWRGGTTEQRRQAEYGEMVVPGARDDEIAYLLMLARAMRSPLIEHVLSPAPGPVARPLHEAA